MVKVAVVGASGYTGVELLRLLAGHPQVEIACITARQHAGEPIAAVFPSLLKRIDLVCEAANAATIAERAEVVFTALPHQAAMEIVPDLLQAGRRVIDLSADYRLRSADIYGTWYGKHGSPQLLAEAVYGLPEIYRERIRGSRLVANPGCYPTSVALALAPLLTERLIDPATLVIDSKSGTSGAGRSATVGSLFCEVNEGFKAYGVASHRHTPEIEQTLSDLAGCASGGQFYATPAAGQPRHSLHLLCRSDDKAGHCRAEPPVPGILRRGAVRSGSSGRRPAQCGSRAREQFLRSRRGRRPPHRPGDRHRRHR